MFVHDFVFKPRLTSSKYWVILGHPEGWTQMDELDEDVLDRLRCCVGTAPIRAFIAGEEIGCVEVEEEK